MSGDNCLKWIKIMGTGTTSTILSKSIGIKIQLKNKLKILFYLLLFFTYNEKVIK